VQAHGRGHARQINAAIALTGLEIALQTGRAALYDTVALQAITVSDQPRLDSTVELVERAKSGDREALDCLFTRFLPALRRWASGRLPQWTRGVMDTDDVVQETVIRAVKRIDVFESRHEGALQAYLRQAVMNRIRDEIRRTKRSPAALAIDENQPDLSASPLEAAIGGEAVSRYEAALARLRPEEREAVVARIEMDGTYQDVAAALGKPSADAARMAVSRALLRLAEEMSRGDA